MCIRDSRKGEPISLAILYINHKSYFDKKACTIQDISNKMQALLSFSDAETKCLLPPNRTTPQSVQLIKEIMECPYKGLIRTCFVEAKTRLFLAIVLQRVSEDAFGTEESAQLANVDLQKMYEAERILVSDLQNSPTIEELAKRMGTNQQKLKQSFKFIFGKSIYQYLIKKRMEAAKRMMMDQYRPVMEVAEAVGYENASHFAKRFKEHFGMLPSKFLSMVWRNGQDN